MAEQAQRVARWDPNDARNQAADAIYRALNRRLGQPSQESGTNSKRWGLAWDAVESLEAAGLSLSLPPVATNAQEG